MDEIVGCAVGRDRGEETNEDVISLLKIFSKHGFEVLINLVKKRLHDQECGKPLRSAHLSVSRKNL